MTRQLIICIVIFLTACGQRNGTIENSKVDNQPLDLVDNLETFSITNVTIEDFTKAKNNYNDIFVRDTFSITKTNGITEIPLQHPPFVTFKDTLVGIGEDQEREYHYLGHFPVIDNYLVSGKFWELQEYYLINKETGNTTTLWNKPFLSPSSKYFANLSMAFGLEGAPNGLQIWKIGTSKQNWLSKYLELDQQIWAPDDLVWETEYSLLLKVVSIDKFWNKKGKLNPNDFYYLRLKLK